MKNFKQPGNTVTVPAPADVSSGDGVQIGSLFGVAVHDALSGEDVTLQIEGVVELPKLSTDANAVGEKLNWNNTNKELQEATSDLDGVGTCVEAAVATTTVTKVKLTPV